MWRTGPAFPTKVPGTPAMGLGHQLWASHPQTLCTHVAVLGFIDKDVGAQRGECHALGPSVKLTEREIKARSAGSRPSRSGMRVGWASLDLGSVRNCILGTRSNLDMPLPPTG